MSAAEPEGNSSSPAMQSQVGKARSNSRQKRSPYAVVACILCASRKKKCDGNQPCACCQRRGVQCVFPNRTAGQTTWASGSTGSSATTPGTGGRTPRAGVTVPPSSVQTCYKGAKWKELFEAFFDRFDPILPIISRNELDAAQHGRALAQVAVWNGAMLVGSWVAGQEGVSINARNALYGSVRMSCKELFDQPSVDSARALLLLAVHETCSGENRLALIHVNLAKTINAPLPENLKVTSFVLHELITMGGIQSKLNPADTTTTNESFTADFNYFVPKEIPTDPAQRKRVEAITELSAVMRRIFVGESGLLDPEIAKELLQRCWRAERIQREHNVAGRMRVVHQAINYALKACIYFRSQRADEALHWAQLATLWPQEELDRLLAFPFYFPILAMCASIHAAVGASEDLANDSVLFKRFSSRYYIHEGAFSRLVEKAKSASLSAGAAQQSEALESLIKDEMRSWADMGRLARGLGLESESTSGEDTEISNQGLFSDLFT